jgi:hypothetical protein
MSLEAEHIAQANRNQAVLEYLLLEPTMCAEWVAVVAFYKALHVVEAIFSRDPAICHTHIHGQRLEKLKHTKVYQSLYPSYRTLWSAATIARYLSGEIKTGSGPTNQAYARFEDYLPVSDLRPRLLDSFLFDFERKASTFLSPNCGGLVTYKRMPSLHS